MRPVVIVHGTWGRAQPWHLPGSPLRIALAEHGFAVHDFLWTGLLAGTPLLDEDLPGDPAQASLGADQGSLLPWLDAGEKLNLFIAHLIARDEIVPYGPWPHVISHSHGMQVVVMAAALGQRFGTWLSLSGPIRRDMQRARRAAMTNFARVVQISDPDEDHIIRAGEGFDGTWGWHYDLKEPEDAVNVHVPGQGHSGLTLDVAEWNRLDLWAYLT